MTDSRLAAGSGDGARQENRTLGLPDCWMLFPSPDSSFPFFNIFVKVYQRHGQGHKCQEWRLMRVMTLGLEPRTFPGPGSSFSLSLTLPSLKATIALTCVAAGEFYPVLTSYK